MKQQAAADWVVVDGVQSGSGLARRLKFVGAERERRAGSWC